MRSSSSEGRVAQPVELAADDEPDTVPDDPDLARDGDRGRAGVSGDHDHPNSRPVAAGDRVGHLRARRVEQRNEPEEDEVSLDLLTALRQRSARRETRRGCRQDAQPLGRPALAPPEDRLTLGVGSGRSAPSAPRIDVQRAMTSSGAPFRWTWRPSCSSSIVDITRSAASKRNAFLRAASRAARVTSAPSAAAACSSASSVGSPALGADLGVVARGERLREAGLRRRRAAAPRRARGLAGISPDRGRLHAVLGQRPRLVGADDGCRAERLDRAQPLDERARASERPHPDRQREGDRGQKALGHVRDDQADRERERVGERKAGHERTEREEDEAGRHGDDRDQPGHPLAPAARAGSPRARPAATALRSARAPSASRWPRRRPAPLRRCRRAAEDEVPRLERWRARVDELRGARDRGRLAGQRGDVHLDGALEQPRIRRDAVALVEQENVAGHEQPRLDHLAPAVAQDARLRREVERERLDRALGLPLLQERERRVEQDHADDRGRQHGRPGHEREQGGDPEEEREGMGQLAEQLAGPAAAAGARELVRALGQQPPLGLAAGEALRSRPQVPQEEADRLVQGDVQVLVER